MCSNGKRTSILENVAISVKKMSVFVVLHRWGTGTLFAQLVGWLVGWLIGHGTQGRQSSKSNGNTETKGTSKQFIIIIIVVVVVNERARGRGDGGGKRPEWNRAQWPCVQWIGGGWTDEQRKNP